MPPARPSTSELVELLQARLRDISNQHLVGDTVLVHPDTYRQLVDHFSANLQGMQNQDLIKNYQVYTEGNTIVAQIQPRMALEYIQVKLNLAAEGEPAVLPEGKDRFEILILE
jgi:DNA repair ATPase RecN